MAGARAVIEGQAQGQYAPRKDGSFNHDRLGAYARRA